MKTKAQITPLLEVYALQANYDSRESFYGKAQVIIEGNKKTLQSYNTRVAYIETLADGDFEVVVNGHYSDTTSRHIKEFLLQNGFKAISTKQILKDYCDK